MTRRSAIRYLGFAGAVSFLPRLRPQDLVLHSDVRLVLLDVSVRDRRGGFVDGLSQGDFKVLENGVPQHITVFAREDVPATIGLLVDESGSMVQKRNRVLAAAGEFIKNSNPQDEMFVLNFNDSVKRGLPEGTLFSADPTTLRAALYRGVPAGRTALNDAVIGGLKQLDLGKQSRKSLVVISDGGDNASRRTRADMVSQVESSLATIYAIGLLDPDDRDQNPGLLRRLADISGGDAFFPDLEGMAAACEKIAHEIRQRYTIGYTPPGSQGTVRRIHVQVAAPEYSGLTAHTRTRYRYEDQNRSDTADKAF